MNGPQEIYLEPVVIPHDTKQVGHWIVRAEDDGAEPRGELLQFAHVHGRLPEHEIEVHRRNRCPL